MTALVDVGFLREGSARNLAPLFHWPPPSWSKDVGRAILLVSHRLAEGEVWIELDESEHAPLGLWQVLIIAHREDVRRAGLAHSGEADGEVPPSKGWRLHPSVLAMLRNTT